MIPPATQTNRLLIPVMPTRPTFCENDVYGKVLNRPPIKVPRPSVRRPRTISAGSIFFPVISPRARNMPADSIMTTIMTMHIVMIGTTLNVGTPNWNG